jgi:hypothetical protein
LENTNTYRPGSKLRTRGIILRNVVIVAAYRGFALVLDEDNGQQWIESAAVVVTWSRRSAGLEALRAKSQPRMQAVA